MKRTEKIQWWVEYNFTNGRPNEIRMFHDKAEADEFAGTVDDGKVVEVKIL